MSGTALDNLSRSLTAAAIYASDTISRNKKAPIFRAGLQEMPNDRLQVTSDSYDSYDSYKR